MVSISCYPYVPQSVLHSKLEQLKRIQTIQQEDSECIQLLSQQLHDLFPCSPSSRQVQSAWWHSIRSRSLSPGTFVQRWHLISKKYRMHFSKSSKHVTSTFITRSGGCSLRLWSSPKISTM